MIATRSLRARIVLLNLALLAFVLAIFSAIVFVRFRYHVEGSTRLELQQDVRRVSGHVLEHYPEWNLQAVKEKLDAYTPADGSGHYLYIRDESGATIYESRDTKWRAMLADPKFRQPPVGTFRRVVSERPLMTYSAVYQARGGPPFHLLAGSSTHNADTLLNDVLLTLIVLGPMLLLVAAGGGLLLINHELRPMMSLRSQADTIGPNSIGSKLIVPQTGDELESLGHTLNAMIGRLEDALAYNRKYSEELSHEIRTPLTIIRMEVEEIAGLADTSDTVQARAGSALEEITGLSALVDRILSLARLDSGGDLSEFLRVDLRQIALETIEQLRLFSEVQGVTLRCNAPSPVWVMGDKSQLKRAIVNLLDNSLKYTRREGWVEIELKNERQEAVVLIHDNGIGIPTDDLERIFNRFFRTHDARGSLRPGFGLGLAIVRTVCEQHLGSISAESIGGKGSTFTLRLPVAEE